MAKGVFRSVAGKLVPVDQDAVVLCARYSGKEVLAGVTRPRNLRHLKKFFALINLLWETTVCGEKYPSKEALRWALTMAAGYVEIIPTRNGPREVPKSIAFENMNQDDFDDLYAACIKLVLTEILPDVTEKDLENELLEFAA